jgi:hypothetical protein
MNQCFLYLNKYKFMNESVYPYTAVKGSVCKYASALGTIRTSNFYNVALNDPAAHMTAVANQPLSIALSAGTSTF